MSVSSAVILRSILSSSQSIFPATAEVAAFISDKGTPRNSGVGIVKEAKRIKANVIFYRKQKNDNSYKYKYIDKYSEVDTIQLFKV